MERLTGTNTSPIQHEQCILTHALVIFMTTEVRKAMELSSFLLVVEDYWLLHHQGQL
jgi:hypothetical protein